MMYYYTKKKNFRKGITILLLRGNHNIKKKYSDIQRKRLLLYGIVLKLDSVVFVLTIACKVLIGTTSTNQISAPINGFLVINAFVRV